MKLKKKLFALAGVTLLSASVLTACGTSSTSAGKESVYSYVYNGDPENLDYITANRASIGDVVANLVDGLLEKDKYGNFVPSLAEDWSVSADGLTYTYTLREDAKWFTADGEEYGAITAEDFVTGLKHAADKKAEGLPIVENSIVGLADYVAGKETDFSKVGVKAIDERTVQYTLTAPEVYWNSKTTLGILFPVNAEFLASQGDDFGSPKPDSILYSGPYLLTGLTTKSAIEFSKNPNYWDADNVNIEKVKWTYYDGSDPESLAKNFLEGNYSVARLFPNSASYPKIAEEHGEEIIYTLPGDTTYFMLPNLARTNYSHTAKTDDKQKESTKKALLNKDFRQALNFAFSRTNYLAQANGEDAAAKGIRNLVVPTDFAPIGDQSFAEVVNEKVAAYGDEWKNVDLSDAQEGIFNADKAKSEFAKAKKELEAQGVTFPIRLDIMTDQASEVGNQQVASLKESIESTLGTENVVVDINPVDEDTYLNATYSATSPEVADYDLSLGGWGPDYQDPQTYLETFESTHNFYAPRFGYKTGESSDVAKAVGFDKYDELLKAAIDEKTDLTARYTKFAEVQAWLTDSALIMPTQSTGGVPRFTTVVPFTVPYGALGLKGNVSYKYVELQDKPVTAKQYEEAAAKFQEEKAKSNADYQESLKDHVK